jgi:hypothetical protein
MKRHYLIGILIPALSLCGPLCLPAAAEDATELYTCSFVGHTPVGILTGSCTTQSQPALGYLARWKFTLMFDQQSSVAAAAIKPDQFYDMLRGQCLEDGSFTTILPLWGDFLVKPDDPEYINGNKACAPAYQVAPSVITISPKSAAPLVLVFLIEERPADYTESTGLPTSDWISNYLESFRRLQLNTANTQPQGQMSIMRNPR